MKNKINLIKIILITIILGLIAPFLINNTYATKNAQCYIEVRKKITISGDWTEGFRNKNFYDAVISKCAHKNNGYDSDSGHYKKNFTLDDGSVVELITLYGDSFQAIKDINEKGSFAAYVESEKEFYKDLGYKNYSACLAGEYGNKTEAWCATNTKVDITSTRVACFNTFSVRLISGPPDKCTNKEDTKAPNLSADKSSDDWKKSIGDITLSVSDDAYSTGIKYSKYSWKSANDCTSHGTDFTNGTKINVPGVGVNKLYLCASDKENSIKDEEGNPCSPSHSKTWSGTYKLDSCSPGHPWNSDGQTCDTIIDTCNSNSKPSDSNLVFNNTYDNVANGTINYTHNGEECGFECSEGTWNGNKCVIPDPEKTCNETTKPLQINNTISNSYIEYINQVFSDEDDAEKITYTENGDTCGYKYICNQGYKWNSDKTKCIKPTPPSGCTDGDTRPECIISLPSEIGFPYTNLLAQNYNYQIQINTPENASPIAYIQYRVENENTGLLGGVNTLYPSSNWHFTWPMTKVDNFRLANGSREYTLRIVKICDEAGNCGNPGDYPKDIIHNVYANTTSFTHFLFNPTTDFTNGKVATGKNENTLNAILRGKHGNQIVTAPPINRTIDFNFNTTHTLNTNQYTNSGNAIELTTPNNSTFSNKIKLGNNSKLFENQKSNNGEYKFNFKVYAPTNITLDNEHDFIINKVNITINQSDSNPNIANKNKDLGNSNVDFNFMPLYTTTFSGEQKDNGFIEGVKQINGYLNISKKASKTTSNLKIKLIKSGNSAGKFNGKGAENTIDIDYIDNQLQTFYTNIGNRNFTSLFTLKPGNSNIGDLEKLTINSWINYVNDSKEITFIGDFVGNKANAANNGLKVQGNTNIDSNKQQDIVSGQNEDSIHNINGKIDKASLRGDIKQKVFSVIKNIHTNSGGISLMSGKIKYYDYRNSSNKIKTIKLNELNNNNTIVILGGNIYIKCDGSECSTDGNNMPGIIILKDNDGIGGQFYIEPNVSRIDAIIYADKSILSYNDANGEISPNNGGTYDILKKQLFIKGSVFSENTIGGSRIGAPKGPVCPFYLGYENNICSLDEAQKYDLNYLRRGIEDKQTGKGNYPVIIEYNSKLQLNPPSLFGN